MWVKSRRSPRPIRRHLSKSVRPTLEALEQRLAPANIPVLTGHYDAFLSGGNTQETVLTPATVNATNFGNLFNYAVDGYTYAQPLYVPNLAIAGGTHNVVFAATEHDSVYAFDADGGGQLWKRSFINPTSGITTVPQQDVISGDVVPEIGITGTPVIDGATNTMYVSVKTKEVVAGIAHYVQRLHALDITTGLDRAANGVVMIGDTTIGGPDGGYTDTTNISVPGTGIGTDGTNVRFNSLREAQRAALTLVNGVVYVTWASHGDNGPYHGWVVGYKASDLSLQKLFNTSPNGNASGIWESGGGLGVDAQGNLYFANGNGFPQGNSLGFNPAIGSYSETVMKLSTTGQLSVADYFTPTDWQNLDNNDADLGSGGTMLLPDAVGSATHPHLVIETGKTGRLYLIDRDNMGKNNTPGPDLNLQTVSLGGPGVWGNAAFFLDQPGTGAPGTGSGIIYYWGTSVPAEAFRITNGVINPTPITQTTFAIGFPGAQPSISSNGANGTSAIMWALRVDNYGQKGPAELMAFKAEDLSTELYSSNATGMRDQFGSSVKFTYPIVSNGHVYAGSNGFLSVFGVFPTAAAAPAAPSNLTGTGLQGGTQIQLSWTNNFTAASPATGNKIYRSPDGVNFQQIATVNRNATTFTDSGLTPATLFYYRVVATNQRGDSAASNTAIIRSRIAAPVLTVADICPGTVDLSWTGTANNHYDVKRSTDGTTFTLIATVPATQTTFMDSGLANGTYFYQVTASSTFPEGTDTGDSNIAKATIGPININHFVSAGNPGFTAHSDMVANGSAQFTTENLLRLNNNFSQAGSAFETQRVGIRGFTTSFQVRLHEGTQPNPADGFTFLIQSNSPTALGGGGGSLGYQGIPNSVAIKFDVFNNEGETDNSTGLFFGGGFPGLPHNPGEVNIPLDPANVNLRSQSTKTITLTYNGTTLTETIHDPTPGQTNNGDFTATYTVDIAGKVGADTAYVGFTGGTGGLFSLQDMLNWRYNEQEGNLPPRAPTNLQVTSVTRHDANRDDVTLHWLCNNAYTATGFVVQRSTDGVNFTQVASLPVTTMTFTDAMVEPGAYFYRVESSNARGTSRPSNTATAEIHVPAAPVNLQTLNLFAQHVQIGWDANSSDQSGFQIERSTDGVNFTAIATVGPYTTSYVDARFAVPVYYRVESLNGDNIAGLPSNVLKINSVGQFVSQDIGAVGFPGTATFDPGTGAYTVNASGSDIWDVADSFNFVYKPLSGDGEIVARVVSLNNPDFWTKAGVMIRADTSAGSADAFMLETGPNFGHNEPVFQWRTDTGGFTSDSDNHVTSEPPAPIWVRLDRVGNTFFGYWALDVNNGQSHGPWQNLGGPQTVNMGTNALVGLGLTAHNNGTTANAVFDHVTVTQTSPTPLAAPTTLTVAHVAPYRSQSSVTISWRPGSDNESGFKIERSSDGVNFTQIGTAAAGATAFTDTTGPNNQGLADGTYYYRVKAFATGLADSGYSNVDSVRFAAPGTALTIDHSGGFTSHNDLTANGNASFVGFVYKLDDGSSEQNFNNSQGVETEDNLVANSFQIAAGTPTLQSISFLLSGNYTNRAISALIYTGSSLTNPHAGSGLTLVSETDTTFTGTNGTFVTIPLAAPVTLPVGQVYWAALLMRGVPGTEFPFNIDVDNPLGRSWFDVGPSQGAPYNVNNTSNARVLGATDHPVVPGFVQAAGNLMVRVNATGPTQPLVARLTDGGFTEASSIFLNSRVGVQNFNTTFAFRITPGTSPTADGMAFVIQGDGAGALGGAGGGLGYGSDHVGGPLGLPRSLAIKFDVFNNSGEGIDSTGIFTNGRSPTIRDPGLAPGFPDASVDLTGTGIDLHSGDPFKVNLGYDGTTLTETITDTVTNASFTTTYVVNIPGLVGSDVGYMGFTGGTGGLTAVQDVQSWTIQTTLSGRPIGDGGDGSPGAAAGGPHPNQLGRGAVTNPTPPAGAYTPAQVRQAYGFDQIAFQSNGSPVAGDGTGQTIAIVVAYNDPSIRKDLDAFDSQFSINGGSQTLLQQYGASTSFLSVVGQNGGTTLPARSNAGWALETALDVEWAHAIAPGANILLVEANSSSLANLLAAVDTARNEPGVVAVSLSWGTSEFNLNPSAASYYDQNLFVTPSNHTGVTFVAASGDNGGINGPTWPSASPNVLSVGGTTLPADVAGNPSLASETAWSGSGGGYSFNANAPNYQLDYFNATGNPVLDPNVSSNSRATPDVAYNADPNTGFPVYSSMTYSGQSGWFQAGGTSAGTPQWSALIAIADQGRQLAGKGTTTNWSLDGANQTLPTLYSLASDTTSYANNFNDITTGSNSYCPAGAGYDVVTGLGTPVANHLVGGLVQGSNLSQATSSPKSKIGAASSSTGTAGTKALTTDPLLPTPIPPAAGSLGQASGPFSPVAVNAVLTTGSPSLQRVSAPASLLVREPGLTVISPLMFQITAPRLLSGPQYLGGESAPWSNDQPDHDQWIYNVPSYGDVRPQTPTPINLANTARKSQAEATAWCLASDACFSDATKPVGLEEDGPAALPIPAEDSTLTLNSAAGLAALAFVLAGSWLTPAEPVTRKRQRFLQ
jgi:hypothetical protein